MKKTPKKQKTQRTAPGKKAANGRKAPDTKAAPKRTIRRLVIELMEKNSSATNAEMIAAVKAEFPEPAFKDTHAAWYRSRAPRGLLTGKRISIPVVRTAKMN
jgi:hypothetical protein